MLREGNSLLMKVGVIMMALALALVIAAAVVSVTLGSEPERVVAILRENARQPEREKGIVLGIVRQFESQIDDA